MNFDTALDILSAQSGRLRGEMGFVWSEQTAQAVHALRFRTRAGAARRGPLPELAAVVGGASSGKSTVFNNLLGGRRASLVTIKSHATRGLILAAHRDQQPQLDTWLLHERLLLPTLVVQPAPGDTDLQGDPLTVTVLYHDEPALRDTVLVDTPDFTSSAAEREGDIALSMLPWFDRLLVVVDHERWFDRQVMDDLGGAAERFGQKRMVIFNRTQQGALGSSDRERLQEQARQLAADRVCVLEYHSGRGFRRFGPEFTREMLTFLDEPRGDRSGSLRREAATRAAAVLVENERRLAALDRLRRVLRHSVTNMSLTSWWECVTALMSPAERDRLDSFSRLLGLSQARDWLDRQRRRIEGTLSRVPWLRLPAASSAPERELPAEPFSREQSGLDFFEAQCERQRRQLNDDAAASEFWDQVRRATGRLPQPLGSDFTESFRGRAREAVGALGRALEAWDAKVAHECQGLSAPVVGSLSMTLVGIAAVLVAVPGPVAALTPVVAAGAIKAGLVKIGAAGVFGALGGRPIARLVEIVREKLLASPEFNDVRMAAERFRQLLEEHGQAAARELEMSAGRLTLAPGEPLLEALRIVRDQENEGHD
ncbi:MAG TPA: 50S ribosome-binding GTPase [Phycisphaerae bacterium]|nr:50S ribosome-binding GTPase [Phycisphaerae bacterium]HQA00062.1 50S ribosome-binding GTPase [Phycisphaerae bacterium]HQE29623.1 50S ribosome-binding GTPase [Phycisphaerae bacterium]